MKIKSLLSDEAHQNYNSIVTLRKNINNCFWSLVRELKKCRDNRFWAILEYESWNSYLAQPEIDLNKKTVKDYIYIYENISKSIKTSDMSDQMIPFNIDIGKLKIIAPRITKENAQELLNKAKYLSRSDLREELREQLITPPIPEGKYDVIYADPPWKYDFSETESREVENQYPTMELEKIKELNIPSAENSILFLWATAPKLKEALEVMSVWGFEYKTNAIWDKEIIGMGYWFRGQHELLLLGTKGNPSTPAQSIRVSSVYREKRGEHSKKPDYYYSLIEKYFPDGKYLELFARKKFNEKWCVYGNQIQQ